MGKSIEIEAHQTCNKVLFQQRLAQQLQQLKSIIRHPGFGLGERYLGAELELYLVDQDFAPAPLNLALLNALNDVQFQPELNQYNIELNQGIFKLKGTPFSLLAQELEHKLKAAQNLAAEFDAHILPIGILPTLQTQHLQPQFMTPVARYQLMTEQLCQLRGEDFHLNINGQDPLKLDLSNVTSEGANTSYQVHMMVEHARFADVFNAAQLTLPFSIALAANSPVLLGNQLWDETRIALFKQSLDTRLNNAVQWQQPVRVPFGDSWVRCDSWELFAQAVSLHTPILPVCAKEDEQAASAESLPKLAELCQHFGTVWPWNRPVYCPDGGGHVRIEFRALPAGPTIPDMVANAAFAIGLAVGMADKIEDFIACLPFRYAEYNFYRAAQNGLSAKLLWPDANHRLVETPIVDLLPDLLALARQGLAKLGVEDSDASANLALIHQRLQQRVTGAIWQKKTLAKLEQSMPVHTACKNMLALYMQHAFSGNTITEWPRLWA